jgi:hypothetical protein
MKYRNLLFRGRRTGRAMLQGESAAWGNEISGKAPHLKKRQSLTEK